ncbi:MAG TPA: plasmid pRiA4b ORF-3 family protein, partial [Propionibacteriaceae bacterium]
EHAILVLIDHDLGGGIKDCWVTDQPEEARQQVRATVAFDPQVEVGPIDWVRAEAILSAALSRPICATDVEQLIDVSAHIALLRRRLGVLNGESWQPAGRRRPAPRRPSPHQDSLLVESPRPSLASLQLKVTLSGSKPPIWRRLVVPESTTLAQLHEVIQIALGWTDSHLHEFEVDGKLYGPAGDWAETLSENVRVSRVVAVGDRFTYVYDFGDDWRHTIHFEKRLPAGSGEGRPRCVAGRRAGPPEDCGGIYGYQELLDAIADPEHADGELLGWAAEALGVTTDQLRAYDPAGLDRDEINAALADR